MPKHDLVTLYTLWGPTLDLDRLLARGRPKGRYDTWRRGEVEYGSSAVTSGLSMTVGSSGSSLAHCRTILRFLEQESAFLDAVKRAIGPRDRSELSTTLTGGYPPPEGVQTQRLSLPASLLRAAARRGVRWSMCVWQEKAHALELRGRPTTR
jgi:hypothetical protein